MKWILIFTKYQKENYPKINQTTTISRKNHQILWQTKWILIFIDMKESIHQQPLHQIVQQHPICTLVVITIFWAKWFICKPSISYCFVWSHINTQCCKTRKKLQKRNRQITFNNYEKKNLQKSANWRNDPKIQHLKLHLYSNFRALLLLLSLKIIKRINKVPFDLFSHVQSHFSHKPSIEVFTFCFQW